MARIDAFARLSVEEALKQLGVDPKRGLSDAEVRARLEKYGKNEIPEKEEPLWHRIFRCF